VNLGVFTNTISSVLTFCFWPTTQTSHSRSESYFPK